jgi:porin
MQNAKPRSLLRRLAALAGLAAVAAPTFALA